MGTIRESPWLLLYPLMRIVRKMTQYVNLSQEHASRYAFIRTRYAAIGMMARVLVETTLLGIAVNNRSLQHEQHLMSFMS